MLSSRGSERELEWPTGPVGILQERRSVLYSVGVVPLAGLPACSPMYSNIVHRTGGGDQAKSQCNQTLYDDAAPTCQPCVLAAQTANKGRCCPHHTCTTILFESFKPLQLFLQLLVTTNRGLVSCVRGS